MAETSGAGGRRAASNFISLRTATCVIFYLLCSIKGAFTSFRNQFWVSQDSYSPQECILTLGPLFRFILYKESNIPSMVLHCMKSKRKRRRNRHRRALPRHLTSFFLSQNSSHDATLSLRGSVPNHQVLTHCYTKRSSKRAKGKPLCVRAGSPSGDFNPIRM